MPNIVCTKLAPNKSKNRRLSFVSFKLDVPRHHFDIIADPALWQTDTEDEITVTEFIDKRKTPVYGTKKNPAQKPESTKKQQHTRQPSNNEKSKGRSQQPKKDEKPKSVGSRRQPQRRNFYQRCQKLCCSQPEPECYRCHDHYVENRHGCRPTNRH